MRIETQEQLKSILDYNPDTGNFTWKCKKGLRNPDGNAGSLDERGYIRIGYKGKGYWAHRLAWLYVNGEFPPNDIDHINRNKSDNRMDNLRLATRNMNNGNSGIWRTNTSGYRGVSFDKNSNKFECYIWKKDRKHHLGYFVDPAEAAKRYNDEALSYFGEYATLNKVTV